MTYEGLRLKILGFRRKKFSALRKKQINKDRFTLFLIIVGVERYMNPII